MKLVIGSDHAGYSLKCKVIDRIRAEGHEIADMGSYDPNPVDFPDIAQKVCAKVLNGEAERGLMFCGTCVGAAIACNKVPGIRCALCHDCFSAQATREHNDANVLAMGGRIIGAGHALAVVDLFLDTPFSNDERHIRRIQGIEN